MQHLFVAYSTRSYATYMYYITLVKPKLPWLCLDREHCFHTSSPYLMYKSTDSMIGMSLLCYFFLPICFQASLKYTNCAKETTPLCHTFLIKIVVWTSQTSNRDGMISDSSSLLPGASVVAVTVDSALLLGPLLVGSDSLLQHCV